MTHPRIIIKPDWKDASGNSRRGCILRPEHLQNPKVMRILEVAAETAPDLIDDEMVVSEGWRDIRDTPDAHERFEAFDFSLNQIDGDESQRRKIGIAWAGRMVRKLGDGHFVQAHGTGRGLHIHAQIRKR